MKGKLYGERKGWQQQQQQQQQTSSWCEHSTRQSRTRHATQPPRAPDVPSVDEASDSRLTCRRISRGRWRALRLAAVAPPPARSRASPRCSNGPHWEPTQTPHCWRPRPYCWARWREGGRGRTRTRTEQGRLSDPAAVKWDVFLRDSGARKHYRFCPQTPPQSTQNESSLW